MASLGLVVHIQHCSRHATECCNLFGVAVVVFEVTVEIVGEVSKALKIGLIVALKKHVGDDGTSIVC